MYLTVKDLSLSFGNKKILNSININVEKGEIVTFLGPSGCGKSTLLRVVAGLESHQEGSIILDGQEIDNIATKNRNIGFVFQNYALFPNMTVTENMEFGLRVKKLQEEEIREEVKSMLEIVQLEEFADRNVGNLSGGQKQRVALARSLITKPKLLLLDEPLSALDAKIRKQLQVDLRRIQKELNITMIFVTHDQEEAMLISDRIFVLNNGEIMQSSPPSELYSNPQNSFIADFVGSFNKLKYRDICKITHKFDDLGESCIYYIRPEYIEIENKKGYIPVGVELDRVVALGNINRYIFKDSSINSIMVDKANSLSDVNLNINKIYINEDSILPIAI